MKTAVLSKKNFFFALGILIFVLCLPKPTLACNLKISPEALTAKTGETVTFRLERYLTHRQCVLPLENTIIKVSGGKLTDPGTWKKGTPDVLIFKVTFSEPGQAIVRVERNCPNEGLLFTEARVNVVQGDTTNNNEQTAGKNEPSTPEQREPAPAQEKDLSAQPPSSFNIEKAAEPVEIAQPETARQENVRENLYTKNLLIWSSFFIAGTLLYLFRKRPARRPLIFLSLLVTGFYLGGCPEPMGAVYFLLARKESLLGISLFLLIVPVVTTLVWGRIFCGWLCPAGAVQEFVYLKGTSAKPVGQLPARADQMLKPVKIIMLATIGYLTWQSGINIWGHYEPFKTLFNFQGAPLTLSFLGVTLLISLLVERPFCRYICPLGAILSLVARFSRYKLKIDEGLCKSCGSCAKINCPTGALECCSKKESSPRIDNAECIRCLRCIDSCRHGALS